ncbi:acetyl-CoA carboxylase biotin carboxyl carrier protein subunit [candidate division NPL-UPA2 bacterium Unc8]|uniref:Acetyl-CoA carboxylase biotin carboxyl carrier protein subunit n=1 Tax=candidate division NPL-UPA2 bacterium Unc8 TaxID=1980939 RepID=A0A399G011_UNCN2|nr:MAG: acetyl-CoA carboxylase biotin carboxyl carrier protein subunit [candidate division NPL-UPA2 bacterium Unc8]
MEVKSPIAGTVCKIIAHCDGADICEGDTIVILESMKMEIPIEAPKSGKITEIRVTEGMSVSEGDVVAVME